MKSRITSKNGDGGTTRTLGGSVYPKGHPILECTGMADSLRAHTALLRLEILEDRLEGYEELAEFLLWLLHCCFIIGAAINDPEKKRPDLRQAEIGPRHLHKLEAEQQRLEAQLQLSNAFIASATTTTAAQADLTATVARALERSIVRLKEAVPAFNADALLAFVNRLSDYFWILARHLEGGDHQPVDYGILDK